MNIDTTNIGIVKLHKANGKEEIFVPSEVDAQLTNVGMVLIIKQKP